MRFAENLKKYRKIKNMTQDDLAEKVFVTRSCISKWERGISEPSLQQLLDLSIAFQLSCDQLIQG